VILIGEIRERETMEYGIAFAETGHLCMSTLHANSTNQPRPDHQLLPEERRASAADDLSLNLKAIISQRLIPEGQQGARGGDRDHAQLAPHGRPHLQGEVHEMRRSSRARASSACRPSTSALDLFEEDMITYEDALRNADSVNACA